MLHGFEKIISYSCEDGRGLKCCSLCEKNNEVVSFLLNAMSLVQGYVN